jgi:hypothetical protein
VARRSSSGAIVADSLARVRKAIPTARRPAARRPASCRRRAALSTEAEASVSAGSRRGVVVPPGGVRRRPGAWLARPRPRAPARSSTKRRNRFAPLMGSGAESLSPPEGGGDKFSRKCDYGPREDWGPRAAQHSRLRMMRRVWEHNGAAFYLSLSPSWERVASRSDSEGEPGEGDRAYLKHSPLIRRTLGFPQRAPLLPRGSRIYPTSAKSNAELG